MESAVFPAFTETTPEFVSLQYALVASQDAEVKVLSVLARLGASVIQPPESISVLLKGPEFIHECTWMTPSSVHGVLSVRTNYVLLVCSLTGSTGDHGAVGTVVI